MVKCIICSEPFKTGSQISFHRFPKKGNRRTQWIAACNISSKTLLPSSVICSKHFKKENFYDEDFASRMRKLKKDVVPSIFNESEELTQKANQTIPNISITNTTHFNANPVSSISDASSSIVDTNKNTSDTISIPSNTSNEIVNSIQRTPYTDLKESIHLVKIESENNHHVKIESESNHHVKIESESNHHVKIESQDFEYSLEELHHSIDIKEEDEFVEEKEDEEINKQETQQQEFWMCTLCHYQTFKKSDSERHLKTHSKQYLFTCRTCNFKFSSKTKFQQHLTRHVGDKQFVTFGIPKMLEKRNSFEIHENKKLCKFTNKT